MTEQLHKFIEDLKKKPTVSKFDETETKQAMILPVLQLLGWNVWDTEEVKPEYPVEGKKAAEGGRVDYCLRIKGKSEVFIEAKRPGEDLERHQEQLLDYSFREGVDLAILSNGICWWFYLARKKGHWKQRKVHAIDIIQQTTGEVVEKFIQLFSKSKVNSGEAIQNAKSINDQLDREKKVLETLPKAWNKIIVEADPRLLDLLADTTESLCGFRPENKIIKDMMGNYEKRILLPETDFIEQKKNEVNDYILNARSPYGHRAYTQAGQIDVLWHQLKEQLHREPSFDEIRKASNEKLTVERISAHLNYWKKRGKYEGFAAIQEKKGRLDILEEFITNECIIIPDEFAAAKELYEAYLKWVKSTGQKRPLSKRAFGMSLGNKGFQKGKGAKGIRLWRGLSLAN